LATLGAPPPPRIAAVLLFMFIDAAHGICW
jgi:hypothetical protein